MLLITSTFKGSGAFLCDFATVSDSGTQQRAGYIIGYLRLN